MYRKQARKQWRYDPREDPSHPHVHVERFKTYAEASIGKRLADLCAGCGKPVRGEIFKCGACMRAESQRRHQGHDVVLPAAPVVDAELECERARLVGKRVRHVNRCAEYVVASVKRRDDGDLLAYEVGYESGAADYCLNLVVLPDDKPEVTTFGELSDGEKFKFANLGTHVWQKHDEASCVIASNPEAAPCFMNRTEPVRRVRA
jgi:hypothetical protein